jgi:MraZ protein
MALTGTFLRNLDEKFRVAIPKRLRDQFTDESLSCLYVSPGTDRSLALYSPIEFERLAERLTARSSQSPDFKNYLRLFYARTEAVPLDSQGRIRIPEWLVELAELKKDVVLVGVHDHAELWDQGLWKEFLEQHGSAFDSMAEAAFR